MKKNTLPLVCGFLCVLSACQKNAAHDASKKVDASHEAVAVQVESVRVETMPRFMVLTGSIVADKQSDIAANVSGRVLHMYVERGSCVRKGQPVASVDARAAEYQAEAASAQAQAAQAQMLWATQECERADTLYAQGAVAKAEFDRLKTQCKAQLHQANAAQANAQLAGKLAGDTMIRSPIDGCVGERYVNVGEYVMPNTRVASVYMTDLVRVSVAVPESVVGSVAVGQALDIEVSAYPEKTFPATVRFISPALRPATRDLMVEAVASNREGLLRAGMFATVRILTGGEEQPTVPVEALHTEGTVKRMFLAKNGQAYEMVVRTGSSKDGRVAVLETLTPSDKVIVNPPANLVDGAAIR